MQAQKQVHASQLWQEGLNDVILKSYDTILLKTLPLVVQCKIFRWWVRKHETISTKKFAFLIVTLWTRKTPFLDNFYAVGSAGFPNFVLKLSKHKTEVLNNSKIDSNHCSATETMHLDVWHSMFLFLFDT